jgi:tRNA threonylcarbamoyladenosine biosynthesis protein TsaE
MLTKNSKETKALAAKMATELVATNNSDAPIESQVEAGAPTSRRDSQLTTRARATILALSGDLGSGKTTFTQGFAKALGVKGRIVSPTFLIMRKYQITNKKTFKNFYHADLYRIEKLNELTALGFKEILNDPENIVLIEWAEKAKRIIPQSAIWVYFDHKEENKRNIRVKKGAP